MSIATVAIGLRVGAGETMRAAIVYGAPLPRGGGRAAWQVRTLEDDGHTRTAISTTLVAKISARGIDRELDVRTNLDGVAEIPFEVKDLATGDRVTLDVREKSGAVLARGDARWPSDASSVAPKIDDDIVLRATRVEGDVKMKVAVLGGALAPGEPCRMWIHDQSTAMSRTRIDASPDLGIEVASPYRASDDPRCAHDGVLELVARGLSGSVALHATDGEGRTGEWYGAVPVAPGAMHVAAPTFSAAGPVRVVITSAGARTLAYVEVDDAVGREAATTVALSGEPPRGEATLDVRTPGRNFIVVSGEPNGAEAMTGATRAFPIWIGENAPCEMSLAKSSGRAFPRFVALDGFVAERATLNARRKRGRTIAFLGLLLGSILETLLLLRAAREGKRQLENVQNAIIAEEALADVPRERRRAKPWSLLDALVVLVLSMLGFALLGAMIDYASK